MAFHPAGLPSQGVRLPANRPGHDGAVDLHPAERVVGQDHAPPKVSLAWFRSRTVTSSARSRSFMLMVK